MAGETAPKKEEEIKKTCGWCGQPARKDCSLCKRCAEKYDSPPIDA